MAGLFCFIPRFGAVTEDEGDENGEEERGNSVKTVEPELVANAEDSKLERRVMDKKMVNRNQRGMKSMNG
jgi:hypothetical protein